MNIPTSIPLTAIVGPTACGKTRRAVALAQAYGADIISADSRQVYRGMDLGTGKDLEEYGPVPYHLIDICQAGTKYNLYQYLRDARKALAEIKSRGKAAIICGGTGLYIESLLKGTALPEVPENPPLRQSLRSKTLEELTGILSRMKTLHNITDVDTPQRAVRAIEIQTYYLEHPDEAEAALNPRPIPGVVIGLDIPREERRRRITERLDARLLQGMTSEVERLLATGIPPEDLIYYGLEYKYVTLYVTGKITLAQMRRDLEIAIHQFAKRQMTWFRGMERRGTAIHWLPFDLSDEEFIAETGKIMQNHRK